jgi:hypothetical protein
MQGAPMLTAKTVNSILHFEGDGLPVLSLYAHLEPGANRRELQTRVSSLLDEIRPLAKDRKIEHEGRISVRDDIARIKDALGKEQWAPGAIAIFACSAGGLYAEVPLPQPVRDRVIVDAKPYSRPMLAVLEEYDRSCVVLVDAASARLWELYQDEMREVGSVTDPRLRKSDYAAGFAEYRVRNKADELRKRHYRHVAELLGELFQQGGYELVVIGGQDHEVPEFIEQLPRELRSRVAGRFHVDFGTLSVADIRARAGAILEQYERERDQQLVADVLEKSAAGGLAVLGLPMCLWAGTVGATRALLVHDGATAPGVVCDQSGWLALAGESCPLCGNATRPAPDVIDQLAQTVIDEGGSVRHIRADTRLNDFLTGADLRFPLPPFPSASQ